MYSMAHFERLVDCERESNYMHELKSERIDIYEKKWRKYVSKQE